MTTRLEAKQFASQRPSRVALPQHGCTAIELEAVQPVLTSVAIFMPP